MSLAHLKLADSLAGILRWSNRSIFHFPEILRYIMCMCVCDGLKSRLTLVAKVFFTHLHFGILQSLTRSDCELPAARLRI